MTGWVVVVHAGYAAERVVCKCDTYDDALTAMHELFPSDFERDELDVDIMKVLDNGELTTEY